jgi:hypothetical protein
MGKMSRLFLFMIMFLSVLTPVCSQSGEELPRFQMLYGPVVGITYVVDVQGDLNERLQEMFPNPERVYRPFFTQFGVNLEQRLRLGSTQSHFAFQEVFVVGGMDQGIFLPSFSFLLGFRSHRGLQFGLGPNLVVRWTQTELELAASVIYAVGWNFSLLGAYVPVSLAVIPTPEDGKPRISIISGFNFEMKRKKKQAEEIARESGAVFVETDPPGAEVFLNGAVQGISPVLIPNVPMGVARIESRKGALYGMKEVRVARGVSKLSLTLAEQKGTLHIKSSNSAVEVFLDGKSLGRLGSGLFERTPVGQHQLELKGWGLYWAGEVAIRLGEIAQIEASPRTFGSITFLLPAGVSAEISGQSFHQTVEGSGLFWTRLEPVWEGTYTVQTVSEIYEPYSTEVLIERGKEVTISPTLFPTAEYEYRQLNQRFEDMEEKLSGASIIDYAEIDRLAALHGEIQSARHEHPELLSRSELLLSKAKKQAEEMARESGTVFVETDPPGADVFVNGVNQGISPVLISNVPLGIARIESRKGALYGMEEVRVARGVSKLSLTLAEQYGTLYVKSSNYAVEVFLDEKKLGRLGSGLFERIPVGQHQLELKGWGLYWAGEVTIPLGEIAQVEASPRAFGTISYSLPTGVSAEISGQSFHQTVEGAGTLAPVWEGAYTVQTASEIYEPYSAEVSIERGKEVTISPTLFPTAEYEYRQLSQRLEDMEGKLSGAPIIAYAEIDRLAALRAEIRSARHEHPDLLTSSESLLAKIRKQKARREIVNLAKFRIEAAQMQLPSQNPAYLGVLPYAQVSFLMNITDSFNSEDFEFDKATYLDKWDFYYRGGYISSILGCSLPLGRSFGLQASFFSSAPGWEGIQGGIFFGEENRAGVQDWGAQVSLGWALIDWLALGAGVSVFSEISGFQPPIGIAAPPGGPETKSAYCFGALLRNADSAVVLDFLCGFSTGRQYLLHAQDYRDFLDFGTPYTLGDSVALPILVEGTLTLAFWDRRLMFVVDQCNKFFVDQTFYTGRITPSVELWLFRWFSLRGALDLSVHKVDDVVVFGSGGAFGISFRNTRGSWDLDLGGSYRMEPIRSIPGAVIYQPPSLYASFIMNLLSKARKH